MLFERKTKDRNMLHVIWFPFLVIGGFLGVASIFGFGPGFYYVAVLVLAASVIPFVTFARTRNIGYLAVGMYLIFFALVCGAAPPLIEDNRDPGVMPLFLAIMYLLLLVVAYQTFNRKLRWRGQEIFELAAMGVEDTGDSYSARPRPSGKVQVSKTEMIRFMDFVVTNLIAFIFREENRIVFVLGLSGKETPYLMGLKKDYQQDTWVAIDFDGQVSVNITEEDYLMFKQDLDFDQLCQAVGNVFIEFVEFSKAGRESQIIDRMNALRLNPFM